MGISVKRGAFIVFEGLDGSGISTQAERLELYLRKHGRRTLLTTEPTNGLIGGMIKEALKQDWKTSFKSLQLLFCADRAKHLEDEIEPAIRDGRIVVCDRYLFSTLAYGFAAGVDTHWLFNVNRAFRMPDLTLFLDMSPDVSMKRIANGREKRELFEKADALNSVRKAYLNLAKRFNFKIINAEQSPDDVGEEVQQVAAKFLARR